jgi:translation initiation factor IF-2
MSDIASNDGKSKVLSLKGKSSTVRQSFSHGRSKAVVVETKRKRVLLQKNPSNPQNLNESEKKQLTEKQSNSDNATGLSELEVDRRRKALETARALESSRLENEKLNSEAREEELKVLRKKKEQEEKIESSQQLDQKSKETNVDTLSAGPLPSELPLVDAPVTKPRVNKSDDTPKKKN